PEVTIVVNNKIINDYRLSQNFPNPFNPSTKIEYSIPQSSQIQIKVFDVLGNEIKTLINEEKPSGAYELTWNAENLPSGVYFYQMRAGGFVQTRKMILLK
ncbi:MAG: T9SS type A sorting domain-containing protein, partial [Candidatus Bathyarchaeota archaeon]